MRAVARIAPAVASAIALLSACSSKEPSDDLPANTASASSSAASQAQPTPTPSVQQSAAVSSTSAASAAPTDSATATGSGDPTASASSNPSGAPSTSSTTEECPPLPEFVEPTKISETGLYADIASETLAPGVREFSPRYPLWSDGAEKRRFAYLPPCSQIDTTEADYWRYPQGTKFWKQFVRNDAQGNPVRVETRLIQKYSKTKWFMAAFVWNDDQTDAERIPGDDLNVVVGVENAKGTMHDVPGQKACDTCHYEMADKALGFSLLQLNHDDDAGKWTLQRLIDEDRLTAPPTLPITLPGTEEQQAALGYMHSNCGSCHNPYARQGTFNMQFWLEIAKLASVEETTTYLSTVMQENAAPDPPENQPLYRVLPQDPEQSSVYWRMVQTPTFPAAPMGGIHMPLIGTEITDDEGVAMVEAWINSLAPVAAPSSTAAAPAASAP